MGVVYKVRHVLLDQLNVIKVIRPQHAGDQDHQQRFLHEARTASRLRHPNIAAIQDFFLDDEGTAYLVMEFIDGITLKDRLFGAGALPQGLALEVARQSLEALSYLHREGYLHRDVSPDNLMLTRDFEGAPLVKLIDLGIAKHLQGETQLTTTGMFIGKAQYSSPEQIQGSADLDPRSDLYSFGVMFYELLTGHCPIEGETLSALVAGHLVHPPLSFDVSDPEGTVPAELRKIVLRLLEKKADDRVGTAQELIRRLAPLQERQPVEEGELGEAPGAATGEGFYGPTVIAGAGRGSLADRLRRALGWARSWKGLAAAAAVVAGVALGAWLLSGGGQGLWAALSNGAVTTPGAGEDAFRTARQDFRQAVLELESQQWNEAARLFRQAAEADPRERAEPVEIGPGSSEPYLPHYFLGLSLYEMRNYVLAMDSWKISENQGVIQDTSKYARMRQLKAESDEVAVEPAIRKAEATLDSADEYGDIVRQMLNDVGLREAWQSAPEVRESARSLLSDLEQAEKQVEDAKRRRDLRALDDAYSATKEVKDALVDLANRMLESS